MPRTLEDGSKGLELEGCAEELSQQLHQEDIPLHTEDDLPPVRLLVIPMTCIFQGYAAYVVCQRYLKAKLGVGHTGQQEHLFTQATVFMHYGKLLARVGHETLCPCYSSWTRVMIAQVLVLLAVLIPPVFVWGFGHLWVGYAFFHYLLLGVGVGVFEGTFLSVISPLGKATKSWAILGAPLGLAVVDVIGQLCTSKTTIAMDPVYIYWYIALCVLLGIAVFASHAPRSCGIVHQQANFFKSLQDGRRWFLPMVPFFLAKAIGNFVMENTPGWFYVYNGSKVPFFSPSAETHLIDPDLYFVLIYIAVLLGDGISRRVAYRFKLETLRSNVVMLGLSVLCSVVGFGLEFLVMACVTLVAGFLAFWGNGLGYAVSAKYIDRYIPKEHNRAVYSLWCMLGDVGSIAGAALVDEVNSFFCHQSYKYECIH